VRDGSSSATAAARDEETVLFLGRLHPVKGIETLLAAWPLVRLVRPRAQLIIAGDGEPDYVASLRATVLGMRSVGGISLAGFLEGGMKESALLAAHAFVLPSLHENFGMAVLEAMSVGTPVVISPDVQLASFVLEHGLGLVAEREPAALAEALVRVLRDDTLRARCRARGSEIVQSAFAADRIGSRLAAMYEFAASSDARAGSRSREPVRV
jgi:glycosyltransferase involved in cell wall biosynthesis